MFAGLGEEAFDDYWQFYLTQDMARRIGSAVPYRNLREYLLWRGKPPVSITDAAAPDDESTGVALGDNVELRDDDEQNV